MTTVLATERLILRRFTHGDVPALLALLAHPSVAGAAPEIEATETGVAMYIDQQNSYELFAEGKCCDLALERKSDGQVIGRVTLVRRAHSQAAMGWALGVEHRGQGFATEAARALVAYGFTTLGLHRIQATTDSDNPASRKVMERLGMKPEACLREAKYHDGRWVDTLTYGLLAQEWPGPGVPAANSGPISKVNLGQKFALFDDFWSPKIVGELNGQQVKLAKLKGEFTWHHHDAADELFFVVKGGLTIELPGQNVVLNEGEFLIVSHGVEHRPVAEEEVHVLLFEPTGTLNTGNVRNVRTVDDLQTI
jgi:RimJ/RimL family protein N-acetyltransferase